MNAWNNFNGGNWENEINVRDFIQKNYTPYDGDGSFSGSGSTAAHDCDCARSSTHLLAEEREKGGVRNRSTPRPLSLSPAFGPGLSRQGQRGYRRPADRRAAQACLQPVWRHAYGALTPAKQYGYEVSPKIEEEFKYHKTHNDGVFSAYTKDVRDSAPRGSDHRPAGCLRPRPHHRRLPPRGAVRRRTV